MSGMICSPPLFTLLCGTLPKPGNHSPLQILHGNGDVLRIIFELACSEWWAAHIIPFPGPTSLPSIPNLLPFNHSTMMLPDDGTGGKLYPKERREIAGCPVAILAHGIDFPSPVSVPPGTFENQTSDNLYVNMMPILLRFQGRAVTILHVPPCCDQYIPLINTCVQRLQQRSQRSLYSDEVSFKLVYLTIDERRVLPGESHRRGGVHVESPGMLPIDPHKCLNGVYIPGAEHFWGRGIMMRSEVIDGGIFMSSNVSNSCAVWNCHVHDREGDVIGVLGDVRRLKDLIGCPLTLAAGDLVWMTDKTPHESYPLRHSAHRQYFRLVTGNVTAWFPNHSTPNPTLSREQMSHLFITHNVNVISGNKFEIYQGKGCCKWKVGSPEEILAAQQEKELWQVLNQGGVGHMFDVLLAQNIRSVESLLSTPLRNCMRGGGIGCHYYEELQLEGILKDLVKYSKQVKEQA